MRHTTRLEFQTLFTTLRPEDKLALYYFHDALSRGKRPMIKSRRGENIATILTYAGLIWCSQGKGEYGVVREFSERGLKFYNFMRSITSVEQLKTQVPDVLSMKKITE